jgi:hypothetical protein
LASIDFAYVSLFLAFLFLETLIMTTSNTARDLSERDLRQRGLVPPEALAKVHAIVVGVGAVGHQVARLLGAMGVPRLTLIDHDRIDVVNLAPQMFAVADLDKYKVDVVSKTVLANNPDALVSTRARKFAPRDIVTTGPGQELAVFSCVDKMSTRSELWTAARTKAGFWADVRMQGDTIRTFASVGPTHTDAYDATLFSDSEAETGQCTSRSLNCAAVIGAGLVVEQFTLWLRRFETADELLFNLRTSELIYGSLQQA